MIAPTVNRIVASSNGRRASVRAGGFTGARVDRESLKLWLPVLGSADADTLPDLPALRARSRDLARNNPIAGSAIETIITNVIGVGVSPQSMVDRDVLGLSEEEALAWQRRADRIFKAWASSPDCDISRTNNFWALQGLIARAELESGDVLTLRRFRARRGDLLATKLQIIEADRLCNKELRPDTRRLAGGVELDTDGAPTAYHIREGHPGDLLILDNKSHRWKVVRAFGRNTGERQVLHHFLRIRPGQTRGIPFLAPVIEELKQLGRYTDAELSATVVSSFLTAFVKTAGGDEGGLSSPDPELQEQVVKTDENDIFFGPAAIVDLDKDEDVEIANPNRPNQAFGDFMTAMKEHIGMGLGIPIEVLTKHFRSSYSAARAALLEAWRGFMVRRGHAIDSFAAPVREWVIAEAIDRGLLVAPGFRSDPLRRRAWLGAKWVGPAQGQIDPLKEGLAALLLIDSGLSTLQAQTAAMGLGDWRQNHEQRAKEAEARREAGLDVESVAKRTVTESLLRDPMDEGAE